MDIILWIVILAYIYFIPWIKAKRKKRKDSFWIFWTNLFIGWTILGWIGCLVWVEQNDE